MNPTPKLTRSIRIEIFIIFLLSIVIFFISGYFDVLETVLEFMEKYEEYEIDEILTVSTFLVFALGFFSFRRFKEEKQINQSLKKAIEEIDQLKSILPICASCKSIRDDDGYWQNIEDYFSQHTDTHFTHGICPTCAKKLYPELSIDEND